MPLSSTFDYASFCMDMDMLKNVNVRSRNSYGFMTKSPNYLRIPFLSFRRAESVTNTRRRSEKGSDQRYAFSDGTTRESFGALAVSPYRDSGKRLWRWPNVFSVTASNGMWRDGILPEVEEQFETSRIMGSSHLRTGEISGGIPANPFLRLRTRLTREARKTRR